VIAIYTTAHGFALIPVGILGMLASGILDRKVRWSQICLFALVGLGCAIVYLNGYTSPTHHPASEPPEVTPVNLARYFLTYMGGPFWTPKARLSRYFGLLGLVIISSSAFYIFRSTLSRIRSAMPWLLLVLYTVTGATITTFGRLKLGIYQAASSRYSAIVILFWISTFVIASMIMVPIGLRFRPATWMVPLAALILILVCGYSYLYYKGLRWIQVRNAIFVQGLPYVLDYDRAPDDQLRVFHPLPSTVRELSRKLEHYQLGPFAGRPPRPVVDSFKQ
jgi:hypothetical protein